MATYVIGKATERQWCKTCETNIPAGALRLGSTGFAYGLSSPTTFWRHFSCITPKVAANIAAVGGLKGTSCAGFASLTPMDALNVERLYNANVGRLLSQILGAL